MPASAIPSPAPSATPSPASSTAVDAYLEKAPPFARPILEHLRELIHTTVPDVEEAIKWSMPFFLYKGIILAHIAAFKAHCSLHIWKEDVQHAVQSAVPKTDKGMGSFGKLTSREELPSDAKLKALLLDAAGKIDRGERTKNWESRANKERPAPRIPEALAIGLQRNAPAAAQFAAMSPSCRREYCEWIAEAKRDETRARRVKQALASIAEGRGRNWKYESC